MAKAGIYISIPFCRQKCSYCNFASDVHPLAMLPRYRNSLSSEITNRRELWKQAEIPSDDVIPVDTIYMGGGTPGLVDSDQLKSLLEAVRASFVFADQAEITIEASPENVIPANAASWAEMGINRVSLGVQSMVRSELRTVGRRHDVGTVARAFACLREAGIENISVDLIAGLPYQTAESWGASLQAVLELNPAHLSVYMLEVDEDSRLGREMLLNGHRYHALAVPSEDQVADFYCTAMEILRPAGFEHYEISNFARPGKASWHNQKYWTNSPYFGFGLDAHSYDGERRWANADTLTAYLEMRENNQSPIVELKKLTSREKLEERWFLGLRRREGISLSRLNSERIDEETGYRGTGRSPCNIEQVFAEPIRGFCEAGWLEMDGDFLRLTDRGLLFSNEVFAGFLQSAGS